MHRKTSLAAAIIIIALIAFAMQPLLASAAKELSRDQKAAYGMGHSIGSKLKDQYGSIDLNAFIDGMKDAFAGKEAKVSDKDFAEAIKSFMDEQAGKSRNEGQSFLAANAKKPGVTTLPSGLQYVEMTKGVGKSPSATDNVVVHYRGTLIDGREFDSSYKRGKPATFPIDGVIKGFSEALQLMKEGAKWKIFIPADLAYGERGVPGSIGPNQTLVFEMELLEVVKPGAPGAPGADR